MKVLTLHACWAWAIAHAGKRIENRTWAPPKSAIGQTIAIHAGMTLGNADDCAELCELAGHTPPLVWPCGVILCTAKLDGYVRLGGELLLETQDELWFTGPYGWQLSNVRPFSTPFPCKGKLGLWELDVTRFLQQGHFG